MGGVEQRPGAPRRHPLPGTLVDGGGALPALMFEGAERFRVARRLDRHGFSRAR